MNPYRGLSLVATLLALFLSAGCVAEHIDRPPVVRAESEQAETPSGLVPGQAKLVRGSESVRGIAGFGRNAIPALFGEYAYAAANGQILGVSVWFTRQALVQDEGWVSLSCPGLPGGFALSQNGSIQDGSLLVLASAEDYSLIIGLPSGFGSPCRFTSVLIERLMFFMRNASREEDISFPAFLRL